MKNVRFGFDEEFGPFDGRTDGSHWNGWLNVEVTAETHAKIRARAFELYGDEGEDDSFAAFEPAADGWVSYANCLTTFDWDADDDN